MINKQIQDISQYIQTGNGNLQNSQKILKEVQKHPEATWEIIVKLTSKLKNKNIQDAYAQIIFLLQDAQKHQTSIKWLKQFMDVHDIGKKIGSSYTINDFLKPEKQKVIPLIHKIIEVSKGIQSLKQSYDGMIIKDELLSKQLRKKNTERTQTSTELYQLKERKKAELPFYEQKVKMCKQIEQLTIYKKNEKLDVTASLKPLKDEIVQKQKQLQAQKFQNQNRNMQIQQLKKQITLNAPQIKKQKRAIEQQYMNMSKQFYQQIQFKKYKQNTTFSLLQARNKYKSEIVSSVNKIIQIFTSNNEQSVKLSKVKQQHQRLNKKYRQLIKRQQQFKDESKSLQIQINNEQSINQTQRQNQFINDINVHKKIKTLQQNNMNIQDMKQKRNKIQELHKIINNQIQQINQKHQAMAKQNYQMIMKQYKIHINSIQQIFQPLEDQYAKLN